MTALLSELKCIFKVTAKNDSLDLKMFQFQMENPKLIERLMECIIETCDPIEQSDLGD